MVFFNYFYKNYNKTISTIRVNKPKSIFKKQEQIEIKLLEILKFGYPESKCKVIFNYLDLRTRLEEQVPIASISNYKGFIESLKYTAAENNVYSLSSPQVKKSCSIFCIHKDLSHYKWSNTDKNVKLDPKDYVAYINPRIIDTTKIFHYEYEECASFPVYLFYKFRLTAKARRPLGIYVSYFDENGKPNEKELFDFEARVFCHEYDHIFGKPMIHWKVSEGDVEVISKDSFDNLKSTIEYYKNRLIDAKTSDASIFSYLDANLYNHNSDTYIEDQLEIADETINKNNRKLSFEEVMLVDIEKGIRKDLKLQLKRDTQEIK